MQHFAKYYESEAQYEVEHSECNLTLGTIRLNVKSGLQSPGYHTKDNVINI